MSDCRRSPRSGRRHTAHLASTALPARRAGDLAVGEDRLEEDERGLRRREFASRLAIDEPGPSVFRIEPGERGRELASFLGRELEAVLPKGFRSRALVPEDIRGPR